MTVYMLKKRRSGASLSEMIVALYVLGIVLLGMMAGILITQGTILYKERARATDIALRTLENLEALPFLVLSNDYYDDKELTKEGIYTITVARTNFNKSADIADSADIRVSVTWGGGVLGGERTVQMNREVSASGSQNIGEIPN